MKQHRHARNRSMPGQKQPFPVHTESALAGAAKSKRETPAPELAFDVFYPHTPDRVWRALTNPAALGQWLLPTDFRPSLGHRFQFRQPAQRGERSVRPQTIHCEVVALEEARRLAYTWQSEGEPEPSLVTWTLQPVEGGTRVRLHHTLPGGERSLTLYMEATANWGTLLQAGLPQALARAGARTRPLGAILLPASGNTVRCVARHRHAPQKATATVGRHQPARTEGRI